MADVQEPPMTLLPMLAIAGGLALLVWSADRFVAGASGLAHAIHLPPLIIGIIVVGFGTSAPEMLVSAVAALDGRPGIALGNAYGSNIANIALILGTAALVAPIAVHPAVLKRDLPILLGSLVVTAVLLADLRLSRLDAVVMLTLFALVLLWSIRRGGGPVEEPEGPVLRLPMAALWTLVGLLLLVASSRLLVWGAVETAQAFGVSDLVIGLTVVAVGTSLPELASSLAAVRRGQPDLAIGNVIGSNLFNTLAVVGIAGAIKSFDVPRDILVRDLPVMTALTVALFVICAGFGRQGRVNRFEGLALLAAFAAYTGYLVTIAG
jgi:cation:H+ antiporter